MCVIHFKSLLSTAEQISAAFNLDAGEVEMEIPMLQSDIHLKAHQDSSNFWCLVNPENYKGVSTAAMKVACPFGST